MSKNIQEEALTLLKEGYSISEISNTLQVSTKTLRKYIPKAGTLEYYRARLAVGHLEILFREKTGKNVILTVRDNRYKEKKFQVRAGTLLSKTREDPEFIFFPSPNEKKEQAARRGKVAPQKSQSPNQGVDTYQKRINEVCPDRYRILCKEYSKGRTYRILDKTRNKEFLYDIEAAISLLRKNSNRVFSASNEENSKLHKAAALRCGITTRFIGGVAVGEFADSKGYARTTVTHYIDCIGEEKTEQLLSQAKAFSRTVIEVLVINWLVEWGIPHQINNKLEGTTYRPDIIIPQAKIVIECDGLYYHSDAHDRNTNNYHVEKKKEYDRLGYKSYFFREDELLSREDVCKSIVAHALGKSMRIGARKTKISGVDPKFFEDNHLMGAGRGERFGLEYEGEIVAGIQLRRVGKKKPGVVDISRFCTRKGTSVTGGFSKLLKEAIRTMKPKVIQTFVDRRYGAGDHLSALGFTKRTEYASFRWTDGIRTWHRLRFRGNSGYAEGLYKLWDCGQAKWELPVVEELTPRPMSTKEEVLGDAPGKPQSAILDKVTRKLFLLGMDDRYNVIGVSSRKTPKGKLFYTISVYDKYRKRKVTKRLSNFMKGLV